MKFPPVATQKVALAHETPVRVACVPGTLNIPPVSDQDFPSQVSTRPWLPSWLVEKPVAAQKIVLVHEIPVNRFAWVAEVDSDDAESRDQVLPFQVRIRFWMELGPP